jgi:glucose/arabinose dehydrogenase
VKRTPLLGMVVALALVACGGDDDTPPSTSAASSTTAGTDGGSGSSATSVAGGDLESVSLSLTDVATVDSPTAMAIRSGSSSLFVTEQVGRVREITVTEDEDDDTKRTFKLVSRPLLDISDDVIAGGERGLLGLAFSPDGRRLYVYYTAQPDGANTLDELTLSGDRLDLGSRRTLLSVDDPYANHNGGEVQFGPDGFLYLGLGDGGSGGDPEGNGQDTNALLGKILRIDPEGGSGDDEYGIPDGNPFADGGGAPEVWLYGVRNPWRFSFDAETDDLWVADVGQNEWEEVNRLPAASGGGRGANLGWNRMEGSHSFERGTNPEGGVLPVLDYSHDDGISVTGGYVYRGDAIEGLQGAYLFTDFARSDLTAIVVDDAGKVTAQRSFETDTPSVSSFGQGPDRELYVLSLGGQIWRIDPG